MSELEPITIDWDSDNPHAAMAECRHGSTRPGDPIAAILLEEDWHSVEADGSKTQMMRLRGECAVCGRIYQTPAKRYVDWIREVNRRTRMKDATRR